VLLDEIIAFHRPCLLAARGMLAKEEQLQRSGRLAGPSFKRRPSAIPLPLPIGSKETETGNVHSLVIKGAYRQRGGRLMGDCASFS
jgi:hypothetical protein